MHNCYCRMATKLLRLLSDKKKMDTGIAGKRTSFVIRLYINKYKIVCTRVEINNACAFVRNK